MLRTPLLFASVVLVTACSVHTGSPTYGTCEVAGDCFFREDECVTVRAPELTASACTRACTSDAECPGAGRCLSEDGETSHCRATCVTSNGCAFAWACMPRSGGRDVCVPGPRGPVELLRPLERCTPGGHDECSTAVQGCFTIDVDAGLAICTSTCSVERPCPAGACIALDGVDFTCLMPCDNGMCPAGHACETSLSDGTAVPAICLPL
jgi:hypothetical protein